MKFRLLVLSLLLLAFSNANAADTYQFDPDHTNVLWHVTHMGYSHQSGKFVGVKGQLALDEKKPENSSVNVTIPIAEIVTGVPKLDEHLKGDKFFNSAKFATATFVSNKVEVTGKDTAKVSGNLTLLGVTKPVVLNVTMNKVAFNDMFKKKVAGFSATTSLKRSDFGMDSYIPMISDEVEIEIQAEAQLAS